MSSRRSSLLIAAAAFTYAAAAAYTAQAGRVMPLEVDGWAEKVRLYHPDRMPAWELWSNPSLWKGPVVPTLFHASYVLVPSEYAPLGLNALAFAAAAYLLHRAFVRGGGHPMAAAAGVLLWVVFPPHRIIFGYYFAEPLVAFLSAGVFALLVRYPRPLVVGLAAGVLLLARSPFLLALAAVPVIVLANARASGLRKRAGAASPAGGLLARGVQHRPAYAGRSPQAWAALYTVGLLAAFLPWGVRNYLVVGEFVPFTVEGGQTLFHGSYLPLEEDRWQVLKTHPPVAAIEAASPADPVARMHYYSGLAKQQILADPVGQAVRCVRKAIKFWVVLEPGTWVPGWKTGLAAAVYLPLAAVGFWRNRRMPLFQWAAVWVVGLWATHAAAFGLVRYNVPVLPMALFLAASAVWPPPRPDAADDAAATAPPPARRP